MAGMTFVTHQAQRFIVKLLAALEAEPMTVRQLAAKLHLSESGVVKYCYHLHGSTPKRIYIIGYGEIFSKGARPPIYAVGDLPDAPKPRFRSPPKPRRYVPKPKRVTWADKALAYLEAYPYSTTRQVADGVGSNKGVIMTTLLRLREQGKVTFTGPGVRGKYWSLAVKREIGAPIQSVRRNWKPVQIEKQGPFAALGVA